LHDNGTTDTLSFKQLECRAHTLAAQFAQQAAPGNCALLLYPPGLEFIAAFLGCLSAGIVAVPAPTPRKNRANFRLLSILQDAAPRLILTTSDVAPTIPSEFAQAGTAIRSVVTDRIATDSPNHWQAPPLRENTLALLQYTSGSTGTPRGVMVSHANLMHNQRAIAQAYRHTRDTVIVGWLPVFHDMGLIGNLLSSLYVGFPCVLLSPISFLREPVRWLRAITHYKGTCAGAPNFAYDYCVHLVQDEEKEGLDLSSWMTAFNAAEPVRAETLDRFAKAFAGCGFRREAFFPNYGLAEATLFVSGGPPDRLPRRVRLCAQALEEHRLELASADTPHVRTFVGCGELGEGIQVTIVDPATGCAYPSGTVGEIWVSSGSVAQGYWNRPDETREIFQAYLAGSGAGPFLRTGDAGFLQDGELFITGRLKDLIIIRGRNLYPQDVEMVVERVVDFVQPNACAAFGIEVDGEERLALVVEADRALVRLARGVERETTAEATSGANSSADAASALDALVGRVRQTVGDEFEVPVHAVAFVRPGTFPRTSSGKVRRRACRDALLSNQLDLVHSWQANASRPEPLQKIMSGGLIPPSQPFRFGDLRRVIHDRLLQWLRAEMDANLTAIDYNVSFSLLGVDSVRAASIGLELEKTLGRRLMPELFYEYPTINQLAHYLEAQPITVVRQGCGEPDPVAAEVKLVATDAEREAVYRFRYDIYVEEMGRQQQYADHTRRRVVEPFDKTGHVFGAFSHGQLIGTVRTNCARDSDLDYYTDLYETWS